MQDIENVIRNGESETVEFNKLTGQRHQQSPETMSSAVGFAGNSGPRV